MSAFVHPSARVADDAQLGAFVVIEADVVIGPGARIGHHVVVREGTRIGTHVRIDDHASIGKQPMRAAASATTSDATVAPAHIGDGVLIGTGAVVYAGCTLGDRVLVADLATVREDVTVGERTIIGRGVAIENHCTVGARCKLETNAYLTAYSTVEDDVFIAPGVLTSNDNFLGRTEARKQHFNGITIRRGGRLGVGAVVLPGKVVEAEAVVAAGAVLTTDAPAAQIIAGVPARPFRPVPPDHLLPE